MAKSPSGSLCPYPYLGGELHPLKYGGFQMDEARLLAVMAAEEAFVLSSGGQHNRRVWIDCYESPWNDRTIDALARHIAALAPKIYRLCFAGFPRRSQGKLLRAMAAHGCALREPPRFVDDPEVGKRWLMGERH